MADNLARLTQAGFTPAGNWSLRGNQLDLILHEPCACERNVLYAFAVDGALVYVGKTIQPLKKRMQGYKSPAVNADHGATTNIKNNRNIVTALTAGHAVDIFVMRSPASQRHGEFDVNLSAGLEDSLIKALAPPWNGRGVSANPLASALVRPGTTLASAQMNFNVADRADTTVSVSPTNPAIQGTPMNPTADNLFAFARSKQGETLLTLTRKTPFWVAVIGNVIEITPGSSKAPRRESRDSIAAVLERFNRTLSFQMSDYQDLSFNASYILALVKSWQLPIKGGFHG